MGWVFINQLVGAPVKRGEKYIVNVAPEIDSRSAESLIRKLNVLLRASMIYSLRLEKNTALKVIVDLARELTDFDGAVFFLYDEDEKSYYPGLIEGFAEGLPASSQHGNAFLEWTLENRLPIRIEEAASRDIESLMQDLSCRSVVSIPILSGHDVPAILQLYNSRPNQFSDETVRFLWILALQLEGCSTRSTGPRSTPPWTWTHSPGCRPTPASRRSLTRSSSAAGATTAPFPCFSSRSTTSPASRSSSSP